MKLFASFFKPARPVVMARYEAKTEDDLSALFAGAAQQPIYQAVVEVLDNEIMARNNDALNMELPDAERIRHLNGAGALLVLKATLEEHTKRAAVMDEQQRAAEMKRK